MRKLLKGIGLTLLVIVILVAAGSALTIWHFHSFQTVVSGTTSEDITLPLYIQMRTLKIPLNNGIELHGWLAVPPRPKGLVWIHPDFGQSYIDWFTLISELYDWGYALIIFNLRGHPPSTGRFAPDKSLLEDYRALVKHVEKMADLPPEWVLMGNGLGALSAWSMLCDTRRPRGLILENPIPEFPQRLIESLEARWDIGLIRLQRWWDFHYHLVYDDTPGRDMLNCYQKYGQDKPHTLVLQTNATFPKTVLDIYNNLPEPKEMQILPTSLVLALASTENRKAVNLLKSFIAEVLPPHPIVAPPPVSTSGKAVTPPPS